MLHQPAPAAPLRATAVRKADDGLSEALDAIARRLEPAIRRAFEEAVARMHARVDATALRRAAEAGDAQAALAAVGLSLEGEELTPMLRPLGRAFEAGARLAPQAVPEARLVFTFDAGAARAVRALREYGVALVRQIAGDTREAAREILTDQLRRGVNPRAVATRLGDASRRGGGADQGSGPGGGAVPTGAGAARPERARGETPRSALRSEHPSRARRRRHDEPGSGGPDCGPLCRANAPAPRRGDRQDREHASREPRAASACICRLA